MLIGYARVSSKDQNLDRQIEDLKKFGCERIFTEKKSGKNFDRPVYQEMRRKLGIGNVLVVESLSRLGRNRKEIKEEWESLMNDEIDVVVLDMPLLDTRKYNELGSAGQFVSELVLEILSWVVEDERNRLLAAQKRGIEVAKAKGKFKGREEKYNKDHPAIKMAIKMYKNNENINDILKTVNISRYTLYKNLNRYGITR